MARRCSPLYVETLESRLALSTNVVAETEANDTFATADAFELPIGEFLQLTGISETNNDADVFTTTFEESSAVHIDLEFMDAPARLEVFNEDGERILDLDPRDGTTSADLSVQGGTSYFFRLQSTESAPAGYLMTLSRERVGDLNLDARVSRDDVIALLRDFAAPPEETRSESDLNQDGTVSLLDLAALQANLDPEPPDVVVETEMNDERPLADPIALGSDRHVIVEGTANTHQDHDFFVFEAPATGTLRVEVETLSTSGLVQVQVEDESGTRIMETDPGEGVNQAEAEVTEGSKLFVRVRGVVDESVDYLLELLLQAMEEEPEE